MYVLCIHASANHLCTCTYILYILVAVLKQSRVDKLCTITARIQPGVFLLHSNLYVSVHNEANNNNLATAEVKLSPACTDDSNNQSFSQSMPLRDHLVPIAFTQAMLEVARKNPSLVLLSRELISQSLATLHLNFRLATGINSLGCGNQRFSPFFSRQNS